MANKTIPVTNHSPGRRAWESPAPPTKMLFVCFGWIWRRRSDLLFSCGYHSRCIITYWKKKSDWIVKPWEHVDQNIQISEVVKVFARKTINNKRDVFFLCEMKKIHIVHLKIGSLIRDRNLTSSVFSCTTRDFHAVTLSLQLLQLPLVANVSFAVSCSRRAGARFFLRYDDDAQAH